METATAVTLVLACIMPLAKASESHKTDMRRRQDPQDIAGHMADVRTVFDNLDVKQPKVARIGQCISAVESELQKFRHPDPVELREHIQQALDLLRQVEKSWMSDVQRGKLRRLRGRLQAVDALLAPRDSTVERHERSVPLFFAVDHA